MPEYTALLRNAVGADGGRELMKNAADKETKKDEEKKAARAAAAGEPDPEGDGEKKDGDDAKKD